MNTDEKLQEEHTSHSLPVKIEVGDFKENFDSDCRNNSLSSSNPLDDSNLRISYNVSTELPNELGIGLK